MARDPGQHGWSDHVQCSIPLCSCDQTAVSLLTILVNRSESGDDRARSIDN